MPTPEQLAADALAEVTPGISVPGLAELVTQMAGLKSTLDGLEQQQKDLQRRYDALRKVTIPRVLHEAGLTKAQFLVGTLSLRSKTYPRVRQENKSRGIDWCRFHGRDVLTFHQGALKELVETLVEDGQPVPDFIETYTEEVAVLIAPKGVAQT